TFQVGDLGTFPGTAGTVSIFGTVDDPGATLTIDSARQWKLSAGTLRGDKIDGGGDPAKPFQITSSGGALDGVTLGVNTTLLQGTTGSGNQVTVLNGLTLANGSVLRLEHSTSEGFAGPNLDVGLNFSGGQQVLGGTGSVELFRARPQSECGGATEEDNDVRVRPTGAGSSLTIGANVTVSNTAGSYLTTVGDPTLPLIIEGTVVAQSSGRT